MDAASASVRRLLVVLFAAGLLLLLDQAADLLATLLSQPVHVGAATWRFGLFGLVSSRTSAFLVGDVMLFAAVIGLGWQTVLRILGVVHLLLAIGLVAGLALFLLDAVQLRGTVPLPSRRAFSLAALRAGFIGLVSIAVLVWAGLSAWRFGKRERPNRRDGSPILAVRPDGPVP